MLRKLISICIGSTLLAIGINGFLVPHQLLDGGIIGIGLIIKYLWNIKVGLSIILFSIPLYIVAWFYYRPFFYNSLHGLLISSLMIDILSVLRGQITFEPMTSSIIGGIFVGAGIGIMLREETSTGGTDLLAQFLSEITKLNVGIIIFIIDVIIVTGGSLIVGTGSFLYSMLVVTVVGLVTSVLTAIKGCRIYTPN